MSMKRTLFLVLTVVFLSGPVLAAETVWQIDPDHSSFQFKVRHLTVSNVKGEFPKFNGFIRFDDQDGSKVRGEVVIEAASITTNHAKRDEHLRGADFFDVGKYPTITFVSKRVVLPGPGRMEVTGDLTIHGVTKEVVLQVQGPTPEVKDPWGGVRRALTATTRINRKDFGITWNKVLDSGGVLVGEDIDLTAEAELVRK
jgi:polyisoprenoid-binding protein YceI